MPEVLGVFSPLLEHLGLFLSWGEGHALICKPDGVCEQDVFKIAALTVALIYGCMQQHACNFDDLTVPDPRGFALVTL